MPIKNVKRKPAKRSTQVLKRPTTDRFFPGTAAPTGRILTCSLLNLFFDPDFLEGLPRGTGFGYFQPQTEETNIFHYVEDERVDLWKLGRVPSAASIRVSIVTTRDSEPVQSVCSIVVKVDVLDKNGMIISSKGELLSQGINISFPADPESEQFHRLLCWSQVVKILKDAAEQAFTKDGQRILNERDYFLGSMGSLWVEAGKYEKSRSDGWLKFWSLAGE